jgi:hypothetical protein
MADYTEALLFYMRSLDRSCDRLVFADNSASDLSPLRTAIAGADSRRQVELISFDGLDFPVEQGRAVGEIKLIERAMTESRLLSSLGSDQHFWKVTGRLRVENMSRLMASTPQGCGVYADFRNIPRRWLELRVFAATGRAFKKVFVDQIEAARQDTLKERGFGTAEESLYQPLLEKRVAEAIVPRFRVQPRIRGFSGSFNADYGSRRMRVKDSVRALCRVAMPHLWV